MTEAGGNPIDSMQGGVYAETLASSMAGLADMFDLLVDDATSSAGNDDVAAGYRSLKERHSQDFIDVQAHGLQLAENIQAGSSNIALTDVESADEYNTAWDLSRSINTD